MIDMVFISRIDMRLGPPKSAFWDPVVVLGVFSIEMQKQLPLELDFGVSVTLMIFSCLTELPLHSPQVLLLKKSNLGANGRTQGF